MLNKFIDYLTFWKKQAAGDKLPINLKMMHGINRITIFMFIAALLFMAVKYLLL